MRRESGSIRLRRRSRAVFSHSRCNGATTASSSAVSLTLIAVFSSSSRACCSCDGSGSIGAALPVAAVQTVLRHVVEEGEELVELLVRDRIELVLVAARAAHRQAHERAGRRLDAVDDVLDLILLGDRPALEVDHVVAVEAGRDLLLEGRVGQQIAGELLDR